MNSSVDDETTNDGADYLDGADDGIKKNPPSAPENVQSMLMCQFKDMPAHVLCTFKVPQGEDVAVCEKHMLFVKDEEVVSYDEEYLVLWPGKNKQLERHACKVLLFHGKTFQFVISLYTYKLYLLQLIFLCFKLDDAKILNNLVKKYTELEINLEDIVAVRENPMLLADQSSSSKCSRKRTQTEKAKQHQETKKTRRSKENADPEVSKTKVEDEKKMSKKAIVNKKNEVLLSVVQQFNNKIDDKEAKVDTLIEAGTSGSSTQVCHLNC